MDTYVWNAIGAEFGSPVLVWVMLGGTMINRDITGDYKNVWANLCKAFNINYE